MRVVNLAGVGITVIAAGGIAAGGESRIEGSSRVEQLLHIIDILIVPYGAEQPEVKSQAFIQRVLGHIHLGGKVARAHLPDDTVVLTKTDRPPVIRHLGASSQGEMVVLHKSRPQNHPLPVRIGSAVHDVQSPCSSYRTVLTAGHHRQELIRMGKTRIAGIRDRELTRRAATRTHLYHACCATRAVLGRLGSILEDGEVLDISGEDSRQGAQVGGHTIHDDQGLVTSGEGVVSTHPHRREHRLRVRVGADSHTGGLPGQDIQRIGQVAAPGGLYTQRVRHRLRRLHILSRIHAPGRNRHRQPKGGRPQCYKHQLPNSLYHISISTS